VRSPHLQMTAWTVVVAASLAMPVLMRGLTVTVPAVAPQLVKIARVPDALTSPYLQPEVSAFPPQVAESGEAPPPRMAPAARVGERSVASWWSVATAFYLFVACVMLLRLLLGLVLTWRLRHAARPVREPWTAGSDVRVSSAVSMPVTFGGTILLPADFADWSAVKRRAAMSHERSHVVRGDFYVLLVARLDRCLLQSAVHVP
jgi:beta-lactamase regulating signal transducer with metallopeptidase domain